mmetsp:Transcript_4386/g.12355  ORF Transcript_4386/g.12355 Transcript_4386/m.12355 type:complete len:249 (-) Transcript_4386:43-789(-)|eukprot:CAMPEP_0181037692 /NCGR_PEP_ID=MMETSP1070-20121207/9539_1 /TAXON_ID=265543 /ORGANISM="Minutocellus polymorphus, Strain NH13" /LENGTH=248 /DNA_ID=CAMNT_0023115429 /DNA_START=153 /DNA_END=902 /DNA_ORIENTATION=-
MTVNPYRFLASLLLVVLVFFSLLPGVHGEGDAKAAAAPATTSIQGTIVLPSGEPVTNTTRITLNDGEYATYSQRDGAFVFHRVGPGVHALNVHSHEHHFPTVKIQLKAENDMEPKCIEYAYAGAAKVVVSYPLELTALAAYQYFEPKPRFNPLRLLKNPMVLMMVVSVGLMAFMPKMMEGMDDEQKEQMRQQMATQNQMMTDPTKAFSNLFGEVAGSGSAAEDDNANRQRRIESSKAGGKTARRGKRD